MLGKLFLLLAGCATLVSAAPASSPEITGDPDNYNGMKLTVQAVMEMEEPATEADSPREVKIMLSSHDSDEEDSDEDSDEDHKVDGETENSDVLAHDSADSGKEDSDETDLTTSSDFTTMALAPVPDITNDIATAANMYLNIPTFAPVDKESNTHIFGEEATEASESERKG
ncbi:PREDICTED: histone-lysine N-methyltransferase SETD1B-like [Condylura cristata]|uniref:histone-lysine N-methyltransferase SETD1B-like n=1 Tax=Condylura cristata TaxID=143302 RepID=UPI000643CAE8|nr:PREDICTED: histone-lysine N-methyltransferase SETD1B-like [Condylura cristata]